MKDRGGRRPGPGDDPQQPAQPGQATRIARPLTDTKRNRPVATLVSLRDLEEIEQAEKRKGLLSIIGKWEGLEEIEWDIEAAVADRHLEGSGRDVSL